MGFDKIIQGAWMFLHLVLAVILGGMAYCLAIAGKEYLVGYVGIMGLIILNGAGLVNRFRRWSAYS